MTKPKVQIEVHKDEENNKKYSVSGKVRKFQFFRIGEFNSFDEAFERGKIMCGITTKKVKG